MLKILIRILIPTIVLATGFESRAALSPAAFSLMPPIQFPSSETSVTGFRLSLLYGHHRDMYGLDLGLLGNITDQDFTGIGLSGIFNVTKGTTTALGMQLAGVTNVNLNKTRVIGLQASALVNYNQAASSVAGVQFAAVNISSFTNIYGLQLGLYNTALDVYGLQIGIINIAKSLHGVQIGLLNFNHTGLFYVAPILNVGF